MKGLKTILDKPYAPIYYWGNILLLLFILAVVIIAGTTKYTFSISLDTQIKKSVQTEQHYAIVEKTDELSHIKKGQKIHFHLKDGKQIKIVKAEINSISNNTNEGNFIIGFNIQQPLNTYTVFENTSRTKAEVILQRSSILKYIF